jgi:hypothetical protein
MYGGSTVDEMAALEGGAGFRVQAYLDVVGLVLLARKDACARCPPDHHALVPQRAPVRGSRGKEVLSASTCATQAKDRLAPIRQIPTPWWLLFDRTAKKRAALPLPRPYLDAVINGDVLVC